MFFSLEIFFKGGLIIDQGDHGLPVLRSWLFPNHDKISVQDPLFSHGNSLDLEDKEVSLPDHGWRDFNHIHVFYRLNRFPGRHLSEERKLKPSGFHGANDFNGPFLVLLPRKTDVTFPFQGLEIGRDRVVGVEAELGAYLLKAGGTAPFLRVSGYWPWHFSSRHHRW